MKLIVSIIAAVCLATLVASDDNKPAWSITGADSKHLCFLGDWSFTVQLIATDNSEGEAKVETQNLTFSPEYTNDTTGSVCDEKDFSTTLELSQENITMSALFTDWVAANKSIVWPDANNIQERYNVTEIWLTADLTDSSLLENFPEEYRKVYTSEPIVLNQTTSFVNADPGSTYQCNSKKELDISMALDNLDSNYTLEVKLVSVEKINLQAFMTSDQNDELSSTITKCTEDCTTNAAVPIIVGCVLAALVVLVIIAYIIGRRQNARNQGFVNFN